MTPCDNCQIRKGCDIFSVMCRLTAAEVVQLRPDLIRPMDRRQRYYLRNKDKYRKWNKAYIQNHRSRRQETERQWRERHKDAIAVRQNNWWNQNKDRVNAERREKRKSQRAA